MLRWRNHFNPGKEIVRIGGIFIAPLVLTLRWLKYALSLASWFFGSGFIFDVKDRTAKFCSNKAKNSPPNLIGSRPLISVQPSFQKLELLVAKALSKIDPIHSQVSGHGLTLAVTAAAAIRFAFVERELPIDLVRDFLSGQSLHISRLFQLKDVHCVVRPVM